MYGLRSIFRVKGASAVSSLNMIRMTVAQALPDSVTFLKDPQQSHINVPAQYKFD